LQGYQQKDIDKIISTYPKFVTDALTKDSDTATIWESIDTTFSSTLGDDWTMTYTLGDCEEITESDLSSLAESMAQSYDATFEFTKGYWVEADMNLSGSKDSADMPLVFAVVQYNNEWKVVYYTARSTSSDASADAAE
jgi:hypothetical protein